MNDSDKSILCIDMDAFFVSVEQVMNPYLKGKAVAVIGAKNRSVIVTSSYEARAHGVKTGMNAPMAKSVCPNLIFVEGHARKYATISKLIAEFLLTISPEAAMYSIDEAFIDLSGTGFSPDKAAFMIKSKIKKQFGLTCTVGAGPNRLIAKMATHINKPDGFYYVGEDQAESFMDSFKLKNIWGIGKSSIKKFADIGIFTPADMRRFGEKRLEQMMGVVGKNIFKLVSGQSEASIPKLEPDMKSIGHSMTFPEDIKTMNDISSYLLQLSEMVSSRARKNNYSGRVVALTVRIADMSIETFRYTLSFNTSATHHIYDSIMRLFLKNVDITKSIRLLGITLGGLDHKRASCLTIETFTKDTDERWKNIYKAIDGINAKFGDKTISYASILKCRRRGATVIAPSWKPSGPRHIDIQNS